MIEFKNVSQFFGDLVVLKDINVRLAERRIAIVGSNGSGKSTFARLINGLQLPTSGAVEVDGIDTRKDAKAVRRNVGFVFQNPDNQIVFPLVEEDLAFDLKNLGFRKDEISEKIDAVLSRYNMEGFRSHPVHFLSGGQKQLLAISGVAVMEPKYIVFDEPTTLLDLRNKRKVCKLIRDLEQTAIVVSHDLEFLEGFDRVFVFDGGQIVVDDQPSTALKQYMEMMA
ncbi:ATP-binding cassette domain-containing protein [Breoghania sp.]|uniref:energy-coupling factor ABC transporter ATP-binding protein n=1 Tax=Breoghania sp. TaxID=2065378 RepID=UPI0026261BA3|nr:ATP-binding cassette domain-containing protein [Breoghania sp.]MDJ0931751.1 ATP-binding cassette domain-containing protein [Breoghania sp.]